MEMHTFGCMFLMCLGVNNYSLGASTCPDTLCVCEHGDISCRWHGRNLTYIPKLDYVRHLQFTGNYLPNVSQETFTNISTTTLMSLSLANNRIQIIANDTFENFHRLRDLTLGINNISVSYFVALFPSVSKLDDLDTLSLESLSIPTLPDNFFDNIAGTQLTILKLRDNNITIVPISVFTSFEYLEVLDLRNNALETFEMKEVMINLYVLNIAHNKIASFPSFCSTNGTSLIPTIGSIFAEYNRLSIINKHSFKCVKTLHKLDVSGNYFKVLENDALQHLVTLRSLFIEWNHVVPLRVMPFAFRSQSLTRLYFRNDVLAKYTFMSYADTFNNTPNIRALDLQSMSFIELDVVDLEQLFSPLTQLRNLILFNGRIHTISSDIFNKMPYLERLNLGRNQISTLKNAPFKNQRFLKSLEIDYNRIGEISKGMLPLTRSRLKYVNLASNPFVCNCDTSWFKEWLANTHVYVKGYPDHYICAGPESEQGKLLKDVTFTYRECHPFSPYEWAAMIGCPSLVVTVAITIILYRNRWNIKHYIYLVRKRRQYERIGNNDYTYDAFVGYSQQDYVWVTGTMLPKLEQEENYILCVHDRDFTPGKYILDNIVTHLDISRKVILVVSNEFAKSEWCRFELKLAQKRSIEDEADTVIVILLEDLHARNLPKSVKVLLNTTTYIEWTNDPVGQRLFWTKLTEALRRPR